LGVPVLVALLFAYRDMLRRSGLAVSANSSKGNKDYPNGNPAQWYGRISTVSFAWWDVAIRCRGGIFCLDVVKMSTTHQCKEVFALFAPPQIKPQQPHPQSSSSKHQSVQAIKPKLMTTVSSMSNLQVR
jgi:hypothetical protein